MPMKGTPKGMSAGKGGEGYLGKGGAFYPPWNDDSGRWGPPLPPKGYGKGEKGWDANDEPLESSYYYPKQPKHLKPGNSVPAFTCHTCGWEAPYYAEYCWGCDTAFPPLSPQELQEVHKQLMDNKKNGGRNKSRDRDRRPSQEHGGSKGGAKGKATGGRMNDRGKGRSKGKAHSDHSCDSDTQSVASTVVDETAGPKYYQDLSEDTVTKIENLKKELNLRLALKEATIASQAPTSTLIIESLEKEIQHFQHSITALKPDAQKVKALTRAHNGTTKALRTAQEERDTLKAQLNSIREQLEAAEDNVAEAYQANRKAQKALEAAQQEAGISLGDENEEAVEVTEKDVIALVKALKSTKAPESVGFTEKVRLAMLTLQYQEEQGTLGGKASITHLASPSPQALTKSSEASVTDIAAAAAAAVAQKLPAPIIGGDSTSTAMSSGLGLPPKPPAPPADGEDDDMFSDPGEVPEIDKQFREGGDEETTDKPKSGYVTPPRLGREGAPPPPKGRHQRSRSHGQGDKPPNSPEALVPGFLGYVRSPHRYHTDRRRRYRPQTAEERQKELEEGEPRRGRTVRVAVDA